MIKKDLKIVIIFLLGILVLCCFVAVLRTLHFFPIYPDEITERTILSRSLYDFPVISTGLRLCKSSMQFLPLVWYIPGTIDWLIYGHIDSLLTLRILGISIHILLLVLLSGLLCYLNWSKLNPLYKKKGNCSCSSSRPTSRGLSAGSRDLEDPMDLADKPRDVGDVRAVTKKVFILFSMCLVVSLFEVGVMPFALITTRPEQAILVLLVGMLIVYSIKNDASDLRKNIVLSSVFFLLLLMILHAHAKALFLAPVFFIIAHKTFSAFNFKLYLFLQLLVIVILGANYIAWSDFYNCENLKGVNEVFQSFNINLGNIIKNPKLFFSEIKDSLLNFNQEIKYISFQSHAEINYLPEIVITKAIKLLNFLLKINSIVLLGFLLVYSFVINLNHLIKRKLVMSDLLILFLTLCAMLGQIINKAKHWYDAAYFWSMLVVVLILVIAKHVTFLSKKKASYFLIGYLFCFSSYSMYLFVNTFKPLFAKGFVGPSLISLYHYNYRKEEANFKEIEKKCGINMQSSKNLILDDSTYLHFQSTKYPLAITYLFFGISDPLQMMTNLLNQYPIEGLILESQFSLPPEIDIPYLTHVGHYVCAPKEKTAELLMLYTKYLLSIR